LRWSYCRFIFSRLFRFIWKCNQLALACHCLFWISNWLWGWYLIR
jgi:hypothetical protein